MNNKTYVTVHNKDNTAAPYPITFYNYSSLQINKVLANALCLMRTKQTDTFTALSKAKEFQLTHARNITVNECEGDLHIHVFGLEITINQKNKGKIDSYSLNIEEYIALNKTP
ncbi:hypothetical protein [Vibrio rotiferianus]|uniref:hypothetical protein n=1 Tax=Vibrio rotiferianus TaxID=190895 RepID=UPI0005EDA5B8|nr:hypothetical protein [Vibrio rotiferianus]